jgi:hypothetical protein
MAIYITLFFFFHVHVLLFFILQDILKNDMNLVNTCLYIIQINSFPAETFSVSEEPS